jgi:protein-disulfide isomerase
MSKRPTDVLANIGTALLVACTLLVLAAELRARLTQSPELPASAQRVENWAALTGEGSRIGSADAPIRVVVFSDYQCPACAALDTALERLQQEGAQTGHRFAVLYRHFPLTAIHAQAVSAALAVECAAEQNSFLEMHRALYREQQSLAQAEWRTIATEAGVSDIEEILDCIGSERLLSRVTTDADVARSLNLPGTPAVIVDGLLLPPGATLDRIGRLIAYGPGQSDGVD